MMKLGGIKDIFNQLINLGWSPIKEGNQGILLLLKEILNLLHWNQEGQIELIWRTP